MANATTDQHEKGSAYILRRALRDNQLFNSPNDIIMDKITMRDLRRIFKGADNLYAWIESYHKEQKTMLKFYANSSFSEFDHSGSGSFMEYITDLVKSRFGYAKKDAWNPADIWMVKNQRAVQGIIEKELAGASGTQTIYELNAICRKLYQEGKLVGVSLKQVSGKVARYEETNVLEKNFKMYDDYNFEVKGVRIAFDAKHKNGLSNEFKTQDTVITIGDAGGHLYTFQVKGNSTSRFANMKVEATDKGATAARLGKAPLNMVAKISADKGIGWNNDNNSYPKTYEEWLKRENEFIKYFNSIKSKPGVSTAYNGDVTENEFIEQMRAGFNSDKLKDRACANNKCNQLWWIAQIYKKGQTQREEYFTDLVLIAAKKGKQFGPFGKLF